MLAGRDGRSPTRSPLGTTDGSGRFGSTGARRTFPDALSSRDDRRLRTVRFDRGEFTRADSGREVRRAPVTEVEGHTPRSAGWLLTVGGRRWHTPTSTVREYD